MPGSATLWLEQQVLAHSLGYGTMAAVTAVYVGLCGPATPPTSSTPGTEVSGGGYARQQATFALTSNNTDIAANTATIAFTAATSGWGGIGYFELWTAATGGQRLYQGPLVDPADGVTPITRNILSGDIVRFSAGAIEVVAT